jgi:hypothetical protein
MLGVLLTSWTIRLALMGYAAVLAWRMSDWPTSAASRRWRLLWTLSCLCFVLHVISAFHFHHHWSHAHAIADTAEQTQKLMGWAFGEGLYFSYLFLIVWVADVLWWWGNETSYVNRPRWLGGAIQLYLLFIAFNGAVVFKSGAIRYAGIAAAVGLTILAGRKLLLPRVGAARMSEAACSLPESSTS